MGDKAADPAKAKKAIEKEVKALGGKLKKDERKAKELAEQKEEIEKKKKPTAEDKKKLKAIFVDWRKLALKQQSEADRTAANIERMLATEMPEEEEELELWKKDLAPWYRKMIEKEPGLSLEKVGIPGRASGDISLKDKKVEIKINGKFD